MDKIKTKLKEFLKTFRILKDPFALIFYIVMLIYVLLLIIPMIWMIISTFKDNIDMALNPMGFPETWTLENFEVAFNKMYIPIYKDGKVTNVYMLKMMWNAFSWAVSGTLLGLFVQILVSYGVCKYKSLVGSIIDGFVLVTMVLPIVGSTAGTMILYRTLGLYDNFWGMLLTCASWGGGNYLLFKGIFKGVSNEYRDAAFIDGASHAQVLFTIMIPMIKTSIIALFILGFIGSWNDYMTALMWLPSRPTIGYGLFRFRENTEISTTPRQLAGCCIVMIPVAVLFLIFRNKIMGNLAMGGLKG